MRPALAALVLVLSACGHADPIGVDSGTPPEHDDAGPLGDAGNDAAAVDAGQADAGTDGAIVIDDGGPDGGLRTYPGECSIVPQSGCASGEACITSRRGDGSSLFESSCVRTTSLHDYGEGAGECTVPVDGGFSQTCRPGLTCGASYGCELYCVVSGPADQCPPLRGAEMTCQPLDATTDPGFPIGSCQTAP